MGKGKARVTSLLLDLDNTLVPDRSAMWEALCSTCATVVSGEPARTEDLARSVRLAAREIWHASTPFAIRQQLGIGSSQFLCAAFTGGTPTIAALGRLVLDGRRRAWAQALAAHSIDPELAAPLEERLIAERLARCAPYECVPELLARLRRRYRLAIVTNGPPDLQHAKVIRAGLAGLVDAVIVSGGVGRAKPDRAIYEAALGALGSRPDTSVMVGDDPTPDIAGAQDAGLRGIWISHGRPLPAGLRPDATLESVCHLPPALDFLGFPDERDPKQ